MYYTRWTLVCIALFVSLDTVLGIPVPMPPKGDGGKNIKESSSNYRAAAQNNPNDVQQTPGGQNWATVPNQGPRQPQHGEHADHMLEAQTVHAALHNQGTSYGALPMHHRTALREMLNDQHNMQFVPGSLNIGKGSLTRHGLQGNAISANPARDGYTRATVPHAVHAADRMDAYLNQHGYQGNVRQTHMNAMRSAGVVGQTSPTPMLNRHQNAVAGPSGTHHQNAVAGPSGTHHRTPSSSSAGSSDSSQHSPTTHALALRHGNTHGTQLQPIPPFHGGGGHVTPPNHGSPPAHPSLHEVRREQASHNPPAHHPDSPTPAHRNTGTGAAATHHHGPVPVTPPHQTGANHPHPPPSTPHRRNSSP